MDTWNPKWVAGFLFLVIGLVWSGGHFGWIIAIGIWTLVGIVVE